MKTDKKILEDVSKLKETLQDLKQVHLENVKWLDSADIKTRFNISDTTLWRLRKNNKIPFSKLGNKIIYPESFFTKSLMKKIENAHLL